jgi:tetratricopeptide (TPR) repeat protein
VSDVATPRGCPDPTLLALYAEGTIDSEARRELECHVSGCAECPLVIAETVRFLRVENTKAAGSDPETRSKKWWWLVAAMVALCIPASVWRISREHDPLQRVRRLANGLAERPVEGQLVGLHHAPFSRPRTTAARDRDVRLRAEVERFADQDAREPHMLHAHGIALLATGSPKQAVEILSRGVRSDNGNAAMWNDLAVAHIALAAVTERSQLGSALRATERAIALAPWMSSPHFNRAVALEHLGRRDEALHEYRRVAALESESAWADEAERRIALLLP